MTAQVRCPHCSGTERIRTARQLHEGPADPSVDLPREWLAPPPAPVRASAATDEKLQWTTTSKVLLSLGSLALFGALLGLLRPPEDMTGASAYEQGARWGAVLMLVMAMVLLILAWILARPRDPKTAASPLIPLEQFPVMVVTMTERARRRPVG